jgi:hypothetical protein
MALLDRVYEGKIQEVVVWNRDRLCRFGIELVQWLFQKANCKLLVHGQSVEQGGDATCLDHATSSLELADDLLSIITVFVARNNGRRSAQKRRERSKPRESGPPKNKKKKENDASKSTEEPRPKHRKRIKQPVQTDSSVSDSDSETDS